MKKIICLLSTSVFLVACSTETQDPSIQPTSIDQTEVDQTDLSQDELDQAQEQERLDIESDLSLYETIDQAELTLSDCSDFKDALSKSNCEDQIYFDLALDQKDASNCESIKSTDLKDICLSEINQSQL